MMRIARMAPVLLVSLVLVGCTSVYSTFPDHSSDVVFKTLVAVAKSPDYTDRPLDKQWFVRENHVYVKDAVHQIEIYRELGRTRKYESRPPQPEQRTWHIEITFDPSSAPPTATFTSLGLSVPAHTEVEGKAYFHQVHQLLEQEDVALQDGSSNGSMPQEAKSDEE